MLSCVATCLAPRLEPLYRSIAELCGAGEFRVQPSWRELASGRIDLAFVCSPPLIWLGGAVEAIAAPVLSDPRFAGQPLYASEVVVARDSPYRSLADLRGARWAFNEPSSWSGYWVTLQRIGSWDYFGRVIAAGFHQRALNLVAEGAADGSAIDCQVLALAHEDDPGLADKVRVVESLGPWPIQPVVVRAGLDPEVKAELRQLLMGLNGPELERFGMLGFSAPPDYAPIARHLPARSTHWGE